MILYRYIYIYIHMNHSPWSFSHKAWGILWFQTHPRHPMGRSPRWCCMRKALRSVESVDDFGGTGTTGRCGKPMGFPREMIYKWIQMVDFQHGYQRLPWIFCSFTTWIYIWSINGGFSTSSLVYLRVPDDELTKREEIAKQNGENYPRWWEFGLATIWFWYDLTIYTMAMDHRQWEMCWPLRRFSATLWILG